MTEASALTRKDVEIETSDGRKLRGRWVLTETPEAVTIIHGATGVPYDYYVPFAKWYAARKNHHVLVYAYRDTGIGDTKVLKQSKTSMSDWGLKDQPAALDHALETFPELPLHTIGHSLGGFCVLFHENADRIVTHTAVNSGLAYWRAHPLSYSIQVFMFWFGVGPLLTLLLGYLPGFILGMSKGIPANVYWEWRRWCIHPEFHRAQWGKTLPVPDLDRFTGELRLIASDDDLLIPKSRVKLLAGFYPKAESTFEVLKPEDFGLRRIGHIEVFSKRRSAVWPRIAGLSQDKSR